jgi:hypothetical protein
MLQKQPTFGTIDRSSEGGQRQEMGVRGQRPTQFGDRERSPYERKKSVHFQRSHTPKNAEAQNKFGQGPASPRMNDDIDFEDDL